MLTRECTTNEMMGVKVKGLLTMGGWAVAIFLLLAFAIEGVDSSGSFPLPEYLAERTVGPAPELSDEERAALGFPQMEPGKDYSDSPQGFQNRAELHQSQSAFNYRFMRPWRSAVAEWTGHYILAARLILGIAILGCVWAFYRSMRRWWTESIIPILSAAVNLKYPGAARATAGVRDMLAGVIRQRQLHKGEEDYKRLESLLKSGLITEEQFAMERAVIAEKVQKAF